MLTKKQTVKRTHEIAVEVSHIMPNIARKILAEFIGQFDLPQAQVLAIQKIHELSCCEESTCRFTDLSRAMHISAPTVTGIVDRLEVGGYAKRVPDNYDRRVINVQLTKKGEKVASTLAEIFIKHWNRIIKQLSPEDAEHYCRISKKVAELI